MSVKNCYINILETSSVSLVAGSTADSSYPLYRTYDRDIGRIFKTQSSATVQILVNQGTTVTAVDRLIIPRGHNLSGMTVDVLRGSSADACTTFMAAITPTTDIINSTWTSTAAQFWIVKVTHTSTAPEIPEIFLTQTYTWERDPHVPTGQIETVYNVDRQETASGKARYLVNGPSKRVREYSIQAASTAQKSSIESLSSAWAGSKPFWLCDHNSDWIYGELTGPLNMIVNENLLFDFDFNFKEVIP